MKSIEAKKSIILSHILMQNSFFWVPVFFGAGIALYFSLNFEPLILPTILFVIIGGISWIFFKDIVLKNFSKFITILLLGFLTIQVKATFIASPKIFNELGPSYIEGIVKSLEERPNGSKRLLLDVLTIDDLDNDQTPSKVRLTVRTEIQDIKAGDRVYTRGVFLPNPEPVYPGDYNFSREAWFKEIGAVGYTIAPVLLSEPKTQKEDSFKSLENTRTAISNKINNHLEGQVAAIATALLTGLRGEISEETNSNMRVSGLAHLLAISGLHMALITGALFFVIRALLAQISNFSTIYNIKKLSAGLSWFGALGYLLISGSSVSTERAFIMVSIMSLAIILDRKAISMRLVAIAAMVIMVLNPSSILSAGFQMSFAAVIGLIAAYQAMGNKIQTLYSRNNSPLKKLGIYLVGISLSTVIAEISIFPFATYHFHLFSSYGLLANLFAVPLMGFIIMPFALLSLLLMPFGLEFIGIYGLGQGIELLLLIAENVSSIPGASLSIIDMPKSSFVLLIISGLLLTLGKGPSPKVLSLALLISSGVSFLFNERPDIIIDREGELIAIKGNDNNYYFNSRRSGRFARNSWLERFGQTDSPNWLELNDHPNNPNLLCDTQGCSLYRVGPTENKRTISFPKNLSAFRDDCSNSDLIISNFRTPNQCPSNAIILNRTDFQKNGAHTIFLNDIIKINSVGRIEGIRIWSDQTLFKPKN